MSISQKASEDPDALIIWRRKWQLIEYPGRPDRNALADSRNHEKKYPKFGTLGNMPWSLYAGVISVAKKKITPDSEFNFEQSLAELEAIVDRMERGDLGLEESISHFEKGINLTRACQKALAEAEQKVQILLRENGDEILADFKETGPDQEQQLQ